MSGYRSGDVVRYVNNGELNFIIDRNIYIVSLQGRWFIQSFVENPENHYGYKLKNYRKKIVYKSNCKRLIEVMYVK